MLASWVGCCIRDSIRTPQYSTTYEYDNRFTRHNTSQHNHQPPDTIRTQMHEDAIDGVVRAGAETAVTTYCYMYEQASSFRDHGTRTQVLY